MEGLERDEGHSPGVALTEKRERFVRLIGQGLSNSEACRIVGVNRRTGTRWRFGRNILNKAGDPVHYPPVTSPITTERSARYLSVDERTTIADLHRRGMGVRAIATDLARAPSTVSRELRRNADDLGRYLPYAAQRRAEARLPRPRRRRVATDEVLGDVVCDLLAREWSPEQVAHELGVRFGDQPCRRLCPEKHLPGDRRPGHCTDQAGKYSLRSPRRRRRRRTHGLQRRGRLTDMTMINQRPAAVADRAQAGHWEGDLIMGRVNQSAIGTLVERQARFLMLVHIPGEHTAEVLRDGVTAAVAQLPPSLRATLTWI